MKTLWIFGAVALLAGCGTPSYEVGSRNDDAYNSESEPQASSLIEMTFGDGDPRVTKNLPADALDTLGDAVRSARDP